MALGTVIVAPMGGHELMTFLLQVGLLLLLALLLGRLASRIGMPPIVGELLAGVLIGPSVLARVLPGVSAWLFPVKPEQFHLVDAVGQLGVVLLVGITGTQVDLGLLRRRGMTAIRIAVPGLAVPFGLGVAAAFAVPALLLGHGSGRLVFALFIGVAMGVSSIPVIAKTLQDMGLLHRNVGQLTLMAATVDDTIGWCLLAVVTALATTGVRGWVIGRQLGLIAAFIAATLLLARPLRAVLRRAGSAGQVTACAVVVMLLAAAASQAIGLEAPLGALLAGIVVGNCGAVAPAQLAALRLVVPAAIAPVFFATVGLRINLAVLGRPTVLLSALLLLAVAIVGKFTGAWLGAHASRLTGWEALAIGTGLNARGAVQLVVATIGLQLGILNAAAYTIIVLIAVVTSLLAAPLLRVTMTRVEQTAQEQLRAAAYTESPTSALPMGPAASTDREPVRQHFTKAPYRHIFTSRRGGTPVARGPDRRQPGGSPRCTAVRPGRSATADPARAAFRSP
jgi:Kef-type K+ transport system membrane component KefB